jgi:hypothetical protein
LKHSGKVVQGKKEEKKNVTDDKVETKNNAGSSKGIVKNVVGEDIRQQTTIQKKGKWNKSKQR